MIPIYNNEPEDWKDLQIRVAKIFSDMGFETDVERKVKLVRGSKKVDVFASKKLKTTEEIHIVECKYWEASVPQDIVHSVRTILADSGANAGYIISKNGFQSGSFEAAENSNLSLLTFNEFQSEFRERWLDAVIDAVDVLGLPLRKISDGYESFYDDELVKLSADGQETFHELQKKYNSISFASTRLLYKNMMSGRLELEYLDSTISRYSQIYRMQISGDSLMEYFDTLKALLIEGLEQFDHLFGKPVRKK